jgi:hypothetical protein
VESTALIPFELTLRKIAVYDKKKTKFNSWAPLVITLLVKVSIQPRPKIVAIALEI